MKTLSGQVDSIQRTRFKISLSVKLLGWTIAFLIIAEALIYIPSIVSYQKRWLEDHFYEARLIAVFHDESKFPDLNETMQDSMAKTLKIKALSVRNSENTTHLIGDTDLYRYNDIYDLDDENIASMFSHFFNMLFARGHRDILVSGSEYRLDAANSKCPECRVEIIIDEDILYEAILSYSWDVFQASVGASVLICILIYYTLSRLLVRPMTLINDNIGKFAQDPLNAQSIITPSRRGDEIGEVEFRLFHLESELFKTLNTQKRFADIGMAVTKIYHDLRNILSTAQVLTDEVAKLDDPKAQKYAPALVRTLDRAVDFCSNTLNYVRTRPTPPNVNSLHLLQLIDEAAHSAGLFTHPFIVFENFIPNNVIVDADEQQINRVFLNLFKNSINAFEYQYETLEHNKKFGASQLAARKGNAEPNGQNSDANQNLDASLNTSTSQNTSTRENSVDESGSDPQAEPPATAKIWVEYELGKDNNHLLIQIWDNGPGIPAKIKENLFHPFYGSNYSLGSGLGLAICNEILMAHGGSIRLLESDIGTVFEISLNGYEGNHLI